MSSETNKTSHAPADHHGIDPATMEAASGDPATGVNTPMVVFGTLVGVLLLAVTVLAGQAWFMYAEGREREEKDAAAANNPALVALNDRSVPSTQPAYRWIDDKRDRAAIPLTDAQQFLVSTGGKPGWATTQPVLTRAPAIATGTLVPGLNPKKVTAGMRLYQSIGCVTCHSVNGSPLVGPTLLNAFGSEIELADGSKVKVDEAYLKESIRQPQAKVHKGYLPSMPDFGPAIKDRDLDNLVEFIKSISPEPAKRVLQGPVGAPPAK